MLSLSYIENRIRDQFSNETKNKPSPFISRLKQWYQRTLASRTHHSFSFTHQRPITHDSVMQSLHEIFPSYEVYVGSASSYEHYQDALECAVVAGNKMLWFTVSNEQVELEITFLITRGHRVEVEIFQKPLEPITYAHRTSSAA